MKTTLKIFDHSASEIPNTEVYYNIENIYDAKAEELLNDVRFCLKLNSVIKLEIVKET